MEWNPLTELVLFSLGGKKNKTKRKRFYATTKMLSQSIQLMDDDADGVRTFLYYFVQRGLHIAARLSAGRLGTRRLRHTVRPLPENLLARIGSPFLQSA